MSNTKTILHFNGGGWLYDAGESHPVWTPDVGSATYNPLGKFGGCLNVAMPYGYGWGGVFRPPGSDLDISYADFCVECWVKFTQFPQKPQGFVATGWQRCNSQAPIPYGPPPWFPDGLGPIWDADHTTWSPLNPAPIWDALSAAWEVGGGLSGNPWPVPSGFLRIIKYQAAIYNHAGARVTLHLPGGNIWIHDPSGFPGWGYSPDYDVNVANYNEGYWMIATDPFGGQIGAADRKITYVYEFGSSNPAWLWIQLKTGYPIQQFGFYYYTDRPEPEHGTSGWHIAFINNNVWQSSVAFGVDHGNPPVVLGEWYHMVVSRREGIMRVYQNDVLLRDQYGQTDFPLWTNWAHIDGNFDVGAIDINADIDEFIFTIGDNESHAGECPDVLDSPTIARTPIVFNCDTYEGQIPQDAGPFEIWNSNVSGIEGSKRLYYTLDVEGGASSWLRILTTLNTGHFPVDGTDGRKYRTKRYNFAPNGSQPVDFIKDIEMLEYDGAFGRITVTFTSHGMLTYDTIDFSGVTQPGWDAINGTQVLAGFGSPPQNKFYFYLGDTWLPNTSYSVGDFVWFESYYFTCNTDHTSDPVDFWNDYGLGYWNDDSPSLYDPITDPGKCSIWKNFWKRTVDSAPSEVWVQGTYYWESSYYEEYTYHDCTLHSSGEHDPFYVAFDVARVTILPPGLYHDRIVIGGPQASNSPQYIDVWLTVHPAVYPEILLSPTSLSPYCYEGGNALPDNFTIENVGDTGSTLNYTITDNSGGWIASCVPNTGSVNEGDPPVTITVNYNAAGLTAGVHTARIKVDDFSATNNPQYVDVTLTVYNPVESMLMRHLKWFWNSFMGCYLRSRR